MLFQNREKYNIIQDFQQTFEKIWDSYRVAYVSWQSN